MQPPKVAEGEQRLPFLMANGTLVIPHDSPERYHWWKPPHETRLSVKETMAEVVAAGRRSAEEVKNGSEL